MTGVTMAYLRRSIRSSRGEKPFPCQPKSEEDGEEPVVDFQLPKVCDRTTPYIFSKGMTLK